MNKAFTLRHLSELTPDEIRLGIKIGTCLERKARLRAQKREAQLKAIHKLLALFPASDNGWPPEVMIKGRMGIKAYKRWHENWQIITAKARQQLNEEGNPSPDNNELLDQANELYDEDRESLKYSDQLKAQDRIRKTRRVWFPANRVPAKRQAPTP